MMTTTATLPPLAAFRAWLEPQPHSRLIGERLAETGCPIARWLHTVYPASVRVDDETIEIGYASLGRSARETYETPEDYRRVIQDIDYCAHGQGTGSAVSVQECLMVLKDIVREEV